MTSKRARANERLRAVSFAAVAATACGLTAGTVLAQAPSQSPGEGLAVEVGDCVKLQSPAERFECYEKQVEAAQRERAEPGAVVTPPAPTAAAPAAAAPAAAAAAPAAAAPASAAATAVVLQAEPTEFAGTISALREIEPRNYLITLDNGQIWRQTRSEYYPLRVGQQVKLSPTHWGSSYRLSTAGTNGFTQVQRVQ